MNHPIDERRRLKGCLGRVLTRALGLYAAGVVDDERPGVTA